MLTRLNLSNNILSGSIPEGIFNLSSSEVSLRNNYLTTKYCPKGRPLFNVERNCIPGPPASSACYNQRSARKCRAFCNASSKKGPCGGVGRCYFKKRTPTCACNRGYKTSPKNPGSCVPIS